MSVRVLYKGLTSFVSIHSRLIKHFFFKLIVVQLLILRGSFVRQSKVVFQVCSTKIERVPFNWSVSKRPINPVRVICLYPRYKGHSLELSWPTFLFVVQTEGLSCVCHCDQISLGMVSWSSLSSSWSIQAHTRIKVTQLQDELSEFIPHRTPADLPTLQHDPSLDQGHLGLTNHGDVISIHRPIHKGPRAMLVVHTIA